MVGTSLCRFALGADHLVGRPWLGCDGHVGHQRPRGRGPHQQGQARLTLASVLRGVISQRLLPRADGKGMVPALEILVNTERVREMIEDPLRTREIKDAIAQGLHPYGMINFDRGLCSAALVIEGDEA